MGSQLVATGKTKNNVEYRIFNIDNVYTVYVKINTQPTAENTNPLEPIYSAIKSFLLLKDAREYADKL